MLVKPLRWELHVNGEVYTYFSEMEAKESSISFQGEFEIFVFYASDFPFQKFKKKKDLLKSFDKSKKEKSRETALIQNRFLDYELVVRIYSERKRNPDRNSAVLAKRYRTSQVSINDSLRIYDQTDSEESYNNLRLELFKKRNLKPTSVKKPQQQTDKDDKGNDVTNFSGKPSGNTFEQNKNNPDHQDNDQDVKKANERKNCGQENGSHDWGIYGI